jgi:hypothetical protein
MLGTAGAAMQRQPCSFHLQTWKQDYNVQHADHRYLSTQASFEHDAAPAHLTAAVIKTHVFIFY